MLFHKSKYFIHKDNHKLVDCEFRGYDRCVSSDSGILGCYCVLGLVVLGVSKEISALKTSGTTHPTTQCHIAEYLTPQPVDCHNNCGAEQSNVLHEVCSLTATRLLPKPYNITVFNYIFIFEK